MDENNESRNTSASDMYKRTGVRRQPQPNHSSPAGGSPELSGRQPAASSRLGRNKKGFLAMLIGVAVLLGALTLTYVYWFQHPDKVVADGLSQAFAAKSFTYEGTITNTGSTQMNAKINGGASEQGATINANFVFDTRGKKYALQGDGLIDVKSDVYLKVKSIDELVANYRNAIPADSRPLFDKIIAKINDKWVKVSSDDIQSYNPQLATAQRCVTAAYRKIQSDNTTRSEFTSIYTKHPFITVEKTLGAKDGSLGYVLTTDSDVSNAFIKEYKNTALYKSLQKCDSSFTIDENTPKQKTTGATRVSIWIDRWSHQITRVVLKEDTKGNATSISVDPTFNQPVSITTPKNATTVDQLQKEIMALLQPAQ